MENIAEQLARRDRFIRHRQLQMTPEQRMVEMRRLQEKAFEVLKQSPEGYAHSIERNFRKRAIDVTLSDVS